MPTATTRPLFEQIDSWLQEIEHTKTAAAPAPSTTKKGGVKQANPDGKPSGMGKTTHPSDDVDNNTHPEQTGSRYQENAEDVKKDIPDSVDSTDPKSGGDQDDKQFNIGTEQAATGEAPSVERDFKGTKDDPGTTQPADAEDIGPKYGSMQLKRLLKVAEDKAHGILADLANGITQGSDQSVQQKVAAVKAAIPAPETKTAAAGYDASAATQNTEKVAAEFIAQTIRDADLDADLVGSFLHTYHQSRVKRAADDDSGAGEDHSGDEPPPSDDGSAGGPPPGADAGGSGDVLSALGAGGPPGGGDPTAGMGAPPGGDPTGGAGAGGPGGGMNQEQALQELAMALQELGISPEELAQIAQQGGAGGPPGGGPPPGAGGIPPGAGGIPPGAGGPPPGVGGPPPGMEAQASAEAVKLAGLVRNFKRAGKFQLSEAKTAQQRLARDQIKDYVRELIGGNR